MLNLSETGRESYAPLKRLLSMRNPDLYLAENIGDFNENKDKIQFPWYKRRGPFPRAFVILENVGINSMEGVEEEKGWFELHDETGSLLVYWHENDKLFFRPKTTFEEARDTQCLLDNDWVYEVFLLRHLEKDLDFIVDITKHKFDRPSEDMDAKSVRLVGLAAQLSY